jgi:hypothetical protein
MEVFFQSLVSVDDYLSTSGLFYALLRFEARKSIAEGYRAPV